MDQKQNTIIESIGVYFPPELVSTEEVLLGCRNKIQFPLEKITGIKSRAVAGRNEFSIDLAGKAIENCLSNSKYDATDIDLLICCNISRYDKEGLISFEPNTSVKLREQLGFSNAITFDIANACAGMFTGIYVVDALIKSGAIRRAMVVSGEYITHLVKSAQKEIENLMDSRLACLTLGDSGAALILEQASEPGTGFQEIDLQTLGRYNSYCVGKASVRDGMIMYTDSLNLTNVAVKHGAKHALQLLDEAGWSGKSFQHLIMHQTSSLTLRSAKDEINRLFQEKVCHDGNTINNLEQRGNTASTSHFVAIADHIQNKKICTGDQVVFSISASGLTVGTALYVFDGLPDRLRHLNGYRDSNRIGKYMNGLEFTTNTERPRIRIESLGTLPLPAIGNKNSMELLKSAASTCLQNSLHQPGDIDLLIYTGVYRSEYVLEPAYAAMLAGELDMNSTGAGTNRKTLAFDIFNGSLGFLNACFVAQQMIVANKAKTALIVAAEIENNRDSVSDTRVGICETASALVLDSSGSNQQGFSRFVFKCHEDSLSSYYTQYAVAEGKQYLEVFKDENIEEIYIDTIVGAVQELLRLENLDLSNINMVLPPQISSDFITRLSKTLGLPTGKCVDVVGEGPELFSSSLVYALQHLYEQGLVKSGDIGLIIMAGSGIQVGCAVYYF